MADRGWTLDPLPGGWTLDPTPEDEAAVRSTVGKAPAARKPSGGYDLDAVTGVSTKPAIQPTRQARERVGKIAAQGTPPPFEEDSAGTVARKFAENLPARAEQWVGGLLQSLPQVESN